MEGDAQFQQVKQSFNSAFEARRNAAIRFAEGDETARVDYVEAAKQGGRSAQGLG